MESQITDKQIDAALSKYPFPDFPTEEYARTLSRELGLKQKRGCWKAQGRGRKEVVRRVIERATTGDRPMAALDAACALGFDSEWLKHVIESSTTGDRSWAALEATKEFALEPEWLKHIIESSTTGDRPMVAFSAAIKFHFGPEWLKGIIEKFNLEPERIEDVGK